MPALVGLMLVLSNALFQSKPLVLMLCQATLLFCRHHTGLFLG